MKDEEDLENKKKEPKENKLRRPPLIEKMVKIKINAKRAIAGVGNAGDVVEVSELVAMNFVAQGLATIIDPPPLPFGHLP